jgi:hypothetical protein
MDMYRTEMLVRQMAEIADDATLVMCVRILSREMLARGLKTLYGKPVSSPER